MVFCGHFRPTTIRLFCGHRLTDRPCSSLIPDRALCESLGFRQLMKGCWTCNARGDSVRSLELDDYLMLNNRSEWSKNKREA